MTLSRCIRRHRHAAHNHCVRYQSVGASACQEALPDDTHICGYQRHHLEPTVRKNSWLQNPINVHSLAIPSNQKTLPEAWFGVIEDSVAFGCELVRNPNRTEGSLNWFRTSRDKVQNLVRIRIFNFIIFITLKMRPVINGWFYGEI
jgi:hypothetical protein